MSLGEAHTGGQGGLWPVGGEGRPGDPGQADHQADHQADLQAHQCPHTEAGAHSPHLTAQSLYLSCQVP